MPSTGINAGRFGHLIALACLLTMASGCATYSNTYQEVEICIVEQRHDDALEILEKRQHPDRDQLLYHLDKAILLRMNGCYAASNEEFEKAKGIIEELSALSLREQASALLINDATRAYVGHPFEQVLIHLYAALNYLEKGDIDAARVEALQVDVRLKELADGDPDSAFSVDPFSRYLSGVVYEELGEWSDALIAYRKAYQAYQTHGQRYPVEVPSFLKIDLLRLTEKLGLDDELSKYRASFDLDHWPPLAAERDHGELIFILHSGLAPIKREESISSLDPKSGQLLRVSLPRYEKRLTAGDRARVIAAGQSVDTEVMEDINQIAIETLKARLPAITTRAIARAALKYAISKKTREENKMAGLLVNVVGVLTERADTRSWLTLPGEIQMARVALPPGVHDVRVELIGTTGQVIGIQEFRDMPIQSGKKTYHSYHWIPSLTTARR